MGLLEERGEYDMGAQYWLDHADRGGPLKPLGKPCHDCAVVDGFYEPLAEDLAKQPAEVIAKVCGNWFCHNHGDRACAGNIAYQECARHALALSKGSDV